jgi:hypothetical protein
MNQYTNKKLSMLWRLTSVSSCGAEIQLKGRVGRASLRELMDAEDLLASGFAIGMGTFRRFPPVLKSGVGWLLRSRRGW